MSLLGRKGKYEEWLTDDSLLLVEGWAREGLNDEQICLKMGISKDTYYRWQKEFSAFSDAIKRGKAPVDIKVENALLKSALGHTITLKKPVKVKLEKQKVGEGKIVEERIEYVDEEVYVPPQVAAQIFWLKNRRPDKWKDKIEQTVVTEVEDLTPIAEMLNDTKETNDPMAEPVTET